MRDITFLFSNNTHFSLIDTNALNPQLPVASPGRNLCRAKDERGILKRGLTWTLCGTR